MSSVGELHRRVLKLEELVKQLIKWTHYNLVIGEQSGDDGVSASTTRREVERSSLRHTEEEESREPLAHFFTVGDTQDETNDFAFEILPQSCNDDSSSNSSDQYNDGDDSDYSPSSNKTLCPKKKKRKVSKRDMSDFNWELPTSSSMKRAMDSINNKTGITNQDSDENMSISCPFIKVKMEEADFNNFDTEMTEDSQFEKNIQVTLSQRGRPQLDIGGHLYYWECDGVDKKIWNCVHLRQRKCNARIHTTTDLENPRLIRSLGDHNHGCNPLKSEVRKFLAVIRQEAVRTTNSATDIVDNCLKQIPEELKEHLPSRFSMIRKIRNIRGEVSITTKMKPRAKIVPFPDAADVSLSTSNSGLGPEDDNEGETEEKLVGDTNITVLETKRGKPMLEMGGWVFHLCSKHAKAKNKMFWDCMQRKSNKCPVRLHTTTDLGNPKALGQIGEHSHERNSTELELRKINIAIQQDAQSTSLTATEIVDKHLPKLSEDAKKMFKTETVKRSIRKIRESLSKPSEDISINLETTQFQVQKSETSANSNLHPIIQSFCSEDDNTIL